METIYIAGAQGAGKTTILKILSAKFGDDVHCIDDVTTESFPYIKYQEEKINIIASQERVSLAPLIEITAENRNWKLKYLIRCLRMLCEPRKRRFRCALQKFFYLKTH